MKLLIYIFLFGFIYNHSISNALSQEVMEQDSIDLREYIKKPYKYVPKEKRDSVEKPRLSAYQFENRWFPAPEDPFYNITLIYQNGFLYDKANDVYPLDFVSVGQPFTNKYPWENKNRKVYESFKVSDYEDSYPERSYNTVGFDFRYGYYLPFSLRLQSVVTFTEGLLFSYRNDRHYLNKNGDKERIEELTTAYLDEILLTGGVGIEIPLWGWMIDPVRAGNYYYLYSDIKYSFPLSSELTQYHQILSARNRIRYENGRDTVEVLSEIEMDNLINDRLHIEAGLGVNLDVERFGFKFELFFNAPLRSVIKDELWMQYAVGMKIGIHFWGLFEL